MTETVGETAIEAWIEKNFRGYGVATRRESDPPHPDEPFMSMAGAKELVRRALTELAAAPQPQPAGSVEVQDPILDGALRILLQLALDEILNLVEAVDHQHNTRAGHMKYVTPWAAITGARKLREDLLVQAAMWGILLSPRREPADALQHLPQGEGAVADIAAERRRQVEVEVLVRQLVEGLVLQRRGHGYVITRTAETDELCEALLGALPSPPSSTEGAR